MNYLTAMFISAILGAAIPLRGMSEMLTASESHNGSRIIFSADGTRLFLSLGEAFRPENAQDLSVLSGKILRMNLDGSVAADNPIP